LHGECPKSREKWGQLPEQVVMTEKFSSHLLLENYDNLEDNEYVGEKSTTGKQKIDGPDW
jgi:hypothetical protein